MNSTRANNASSEFTIPLPYQADRRSPVRWILSHSLRKWLLWLSILGGSLGNAALLALVQTQIGVAFDVVLGSTPAVQALIRIAIIIAVATLGRGVFQFARNFGAELMAQKVERDIRNELYVTLLGKSMTFHSLQPVGDTMARATNDVREVNFLFSPGLSMVIGSLNFLFMPLIVAPRYHPSLILTPLLFIIAYALALWAYLRELRSITDEVRESFGALNTRLAEALEGIETVKGASQEEGEVKRFSRNIQRYRDAAVHQGDVEARFLPMLLLSLAMGAGLFHALYLHAQGLIAIGDVVAYFGLLLMLDFPTFTSLWAYSQISLGLAGARRILDLMNRENNLDQNTAGYAQPLQGEVEFRDVCFSYQGDDEGCTLENISFKVKPGQTVAIVGQTGSGKTSIARLINRTYDVNSGQVLVDGVDVREWNLESLRRGISIIEQDIFLFSRSIAENVSFGKPGATPAEVQAAAKAAQVDEFIAAFSEGLGTVVGERGVTLSGGQRQRVALARAFLTDPRILVLDDSTSAIDSATEDKIQRAIFAAARGRTTFIITHRLSQIRWADVILVIRAGRIAAIGSHDELMQSSDAYRRIFSE